MCLILFANNVHPKYKLILVANRDEFYKRPTRPAQWWEDKSDVLAGKDLEGGGTWMGISKSGRIAALTNYRKLPVNEKYNSTRGKLVTDFLDESISRTDYLKKLEDSSNDYDGYNLVFGNADQLTYYSNKGGEESDVEPGIHGLSNALLDTPWPKVKLGKEALSTIVNESEDIVPDRLFEILHNTDLAPDEELPDTGIGIEYERVLSAAFINPISIGSPDYGTRLSTVILIDKENKVHFEERAFVPESNNLFKFIVS
ncbi:MAG: hypothetical protein COB85_04455 [Bacteroidetes bacterium]|nr:MAG: hypothetical protein COB85_04455 [Bacteroidota bacterium]